MTEDETKNACAPAQDEMTPAPDAAEITAPVTPEPEPFEDIPEFLRRSPDDPKSELMLSHPDVAQAPCVFKPEPRPVPSCRRLYPLTERDLEVIKELTTGKEEKINAAKAVRDAKAKARADAAVAKDLGQRWNSRLNKWESPPLAYARSLHDKPREKSP